MTADADVIHHAAIMLRTIADRVGDRFDYVIGDAGPFREAAEALDKIAGRDE